ncbi:hypothetical protein ACFVXQ_32885, partial [Kitasatospora sp. NPDC058263]
MLPPVKGAKTSRRPSVFGATTGAPATPPASGRQFDQLPSSPAVYCQLCQSGPLAPSWTKISKRPSALRPAQD